MPKRAVYVGRPSLWGNPYTLGAVRALYPEIPATERAAAAVRLYRRELERFGLLSDYAYLVSDDRYDATAAAVHASGASSMADFAAISLRGKTLVCWCPLEDDEGNRIPCHADVLLDLANR